MQKLNKVFCLVTDCHASTGYYQSLWRKHFQEGVASQTISCLFPTEVSFDWARTPEPSADESRLRAEQSERLSQQIKRAIATVGLDAVISYAYSRDLDMGLIDEVTQRLSVPWINFYCDSTHRFSLVEKLAARVTMNWFPESGALDRYKALGRKTLCLPYAMNPQHLPDLGLTHPARNTAFIGLPTANRIRQLGALICAGVEVEIRGKGWLATETPFYNPVPAHKRFWAILRDGGFGEKIAKRILWPVVKKRAGLPLSEAEFETYVQETAVVLGLNQGRDEEGRTDSYLKFRDIEFPGYGCCYLTQRNSDIQSVFQEGKEILTFNDTWEASRILKRMSEDPDRCRAIGMAGRKKVLHEHGWARRMEQLSQALYG
jgi:hypothetical protein